MRVCTCTHTHTHTCAHTYTQTQNNILQTGRGKGQCCVTEICCRPALNGDNMLLYFKAGLWKWKGMNCEASGLRWQSGLCLCMNGQPVKLSFSPSSSITAVFQPAFDWGQVDRAALARCLLTLCRHVKEELAGEPRLLKLRSPTYILGW